MCFVSNLPNLSVETLNLVDSCIDRLTNSVSTDNRSEPLEVARGLAAAARFPVARFLVLTGTSEAGKAVA